MSHWLRWRRYLQRLFAILKLVQLLHISVAERDSAISWFREVSPVSFECQERLFLSLLCVPQALETPAVQAEATIANDGCCAGTSAREQQIHPNLHFISLRCRLWYFHVHSILFGCANLVLIDRLQRRLRGFPLRHQTDIESCLNFRLPKVQATSMWCDIVIHGE